MPRPKPLRRINEPQPITVSSDAAQRPTAAHLDGERKTVVRIQDQWMITDNWWSAPEHQVDRHYFRILLDDGNALTVFRDRVGNRWYQQDYTHPADLGVSPGGAWD